MKATGEEIHLFCRCWLPNLQIPVKFPENSTNSRSRSSILASIESACATSY